MNLTSTSKNVKKMVWRAHPIPYRILLILPPKLPKCRYIYIYTVHGWYGYLDDCNSSSVDPLRMWASNRYLISGTWTVLHPSATTVHAQIWTSSKTSFLVWFAMLPYSVLWMIDWISKNSIKPSAFHWTARLPRLPVNENHHQGQWYW